MIEFSKIQNRFPSGNANGDFYLHNLYAPDGDGGAVVKSSYQRILGLHKGPIHDLAVGALYRNEERLGGIL